MQNENNFKTKHKILLYKTYINFKNLYSKITNLRTISVLLNFLRVLKASYALDLLRFLFLFY